MNLQLTSKTAFISGSTQGIGFAIAKQLAEEGVRVIINGRSKVAEAVKRLKDIVPDAQVEGIAADFSDVAQVEHLIGQLPPVDILVNNVGVFELKPFAAISDDDWMRFFDINVMSGVRLSRGLLPNMLAQQWGRIIFISSESGVNVPENMIHYGMTKTAMMSISNGLAKMTKGTGITVNTILGGPTYSDGVKNVITQIAAAQEMEVEALKTHIHTSTNPTSLLQRFIAPEEIASLVAYIASPLSIATNGATLRADGGVLTTL